MSTTDLLIPGPVTDLDHKVNAAYARALATSKRQYVYLYADRLYISGVRPAKLRAVVISPEGWAIVLEADADESLLGKEQ